jgi:hypothetical protein
MAPTVLLLHHTLLFICKRHTPTVEVFDVSVQQCKTGKVCGYGRVGWNDEMLPSALAFCSPLKQSKSQLPSLLSQDILSLVNLRRILRLKLKLKQ